MICGNCGQELRDGVKFCTKCGSKFSTELAIKNKILTYLSLLLSVVGIVGLIIVYQIYWNATDRNLFPTFIRILNIFRIPIFAGIILAILVLYRQKYKLALIAGLIPCGYYVLAILLRLLPFLNTISRFLPF